MALARRSASPARRVRCAGRGRAASVPRPGARRETSSDSARRFSGWTLAASCRAGRRSLVVTRRGRAAGAAKPPPYASRRCRRLAARPVAAVAPDGAGRTSARAIATDPARDPSGRAARLACSGPAARTSQRVSAWLTPGWTCRRGQSRWRAPSRGRTLQCNPDRCGGRVPRGAPALLSGRAAGQP
jgi:hypothetical protein